MLNMLKRRLIYVFALLMLLSALAVVVAYAGDGIDSEPNNSMNEAELISFRGTNGEERVVGAIGYIGYNGDEDWYKIYLTSGFYSATLTNNNTSNPNNIFGSLPADYDLFIYNSSGSEIARSYNAGTTPEQCHFTISSAGYYYVRVDGYGSAYSSSTPYKMMLTKGDTAFYMEGQRYRLFPHPFYGRLNGGTEYHSTGVAYSYGSKDSLSQYESKMAEADTYKTKPQDNWNDYSSAHPRPGRWQSEYEAGDTGQANWAGIDCSGLIWRATAASSINYAIENYSVYNVNTIVISNNATQIPYSSAEIGDVYVSSSHVVFISRLGSSEGRTSIIHAFSSSSARKVQETSISAINSAPIPAKP